MCARSKGDSDSLLPVLGNCGNKLVLLRFVDRDINSNGIEREAINQNFRVLICDGQNTNF